VISFSGNGSALTSPGGEENRKANSRKEMVIKKNGLSLFVLFFIPPSPFLFAGKL
jgi:hypothetical protein